MKPSPVPAPKASLKVGQADAATAGGSVGSSTSGSTGLSTGPVPATHLLPSSTAACAMTKSTVRSQRSSVVLPSPSRSSASATSSPAQVRGGTPFSNTLTRFVYVPSAVNARMRVATSTRGICAAVRGKLPL